MKVFQNPESFEAPVRPVVTIGTFDGVHTGHRYIIERLKERAAAEEGTSVLVTFWPHPRLVLHPEQHDLRLLNTMDEKKELLYRYGLDYLLMIPFSQTFANLRKDAFIKNILVDTLQTHVLVVGYDHRFGKNREGRFRDLEEASGKYGFSVEEIPPQTIDDIAVSSTKIRKALFDGDVETARHYLQYPYFLTGKVVAGRKLGRSINFPTANIHISEDYKLIPAEGVYVAWVKVEGDYYRGMLNIGTRPTIDGKNQTIETHLLNFDGSLYNQTIRVYLMQWIRQEMQFANLDALKSQLFKDKKATETYFGKHPKTPGDCP